MSLAKINSVFEMALRNLARTKSRQIGDLEFEEAFETFNNGERKEWNKELLKQVACHEAVHG